MNFVLHYIVQAQKKSLKNDVQLICGASDGENNSTESLPVMSNKIVHTSGRIMVHVSMQHLSSFI